MRRVFVVSAVVASVVIGSCILAGAAMLQYEPARQHVEIEITPVAKCNGQLCNGTAK
jgi:hypothetical protein